MVTLGINVNKTFLTAVAVDPITCSEKEVFVDSKPLTNEWTDKCVMLENRSGYLALTLHSQSTHKKRCDWSWKQNIDRSDHRHCYGVFRRSNSARRKNIWHCGIIVCHCWVCKKTRYGITDINGFTQDCSNSIANVMELLQSCAKAIDITWGTLTWISSAVLPPPSPHLLPFSSWVAFWLALLKEFWAGVEPQAWNYMN